MRPEIDFNGEQHRDEADYLMPLGEEERQDLAFALELACTRAISENDEEQCNDFHELYEQLQNFELIKD
jgi:hypothetical protein